MENLHQRDNRPENNEEWLELVKKCVAGVRFGQVVIFIHNSKVVQIEKMERLRLDKTENFLKPKTD